MENRTSAYAVIPIYILENKDLSNGSKLLYARLSALANSEGYCFANNRYLSDKLGVSQNMIGRLLKELKEKDHIKVVLTNNNKRKIYLTSIIIPQNIKREQIKELFDYDWLNDKEEKELFDYDWLNDKD